MEGKLMLDIKQEPEDDYFECKYEPLRSLVLKFIKKENGCYSVVPFIKPDPFCEDEHVNNQNETCEFNVSSVKGNDIIKKEIPVQNVNREKLEKNNSKKKNNSSKKRRKLPSVRSRQCPFCTANHFKEPVSLESHILVKHMHIKYAINYITRKIFSCKLCHYRTLKSHNLTRHLTTHPELKKRQNEHKLAQPYNCFHCHYQTFDKGSIIKHVRLHKTSNHLPFVCTVCNYGFNERNSLNSHIVKRHLDNSELLRMVSTHIYECELCDYKDVNKSKMKRHKKARHVKKERKMRKSKKKLPHRDSFV